MLRRGQLEGAGVGLVGAMVGLEPGAGARVDLHLHTFPLAGFEAQRHYTPPTETYNEQEPVLQSRLGRSRK